MASTTPKPVADADVPSRLFHSTSAKLSMGDILVPGAQVGKGRGQWVWMDTVARSAGWSGSRGGGSDQHVYEVEPLDEVQDARGYYRTKRARVKNVVSTDREAQR